MDAADAALPSLREVLAVPEIQRGGPEVLAGEVNLDQPVRWVHVSELHDIAHLLQGGELILTTGLGLIDERPELRRYIEELVRVGAVGVIIELGRRFRDLPRALVEAATPHGFPLVTLRHEIPFVRVTEAVHVDIVDRHVKLLRHTQQVHTVFTDLAVEGALPEAIVREAAELSGLPTVLENLSHRVIAAHHPSGELTELLEGWGRRARRLRSGGRVDTVTDGPETWLICEVGARGERWGRLLIHLDQRTISAPQQVTTLLERAATALVLNRLTDRERLPYEAQAGAALVSQLRDGSTTAPASLSARAEALGVPLRDRLLTAVVVRPQPDEQDLAIGGENLTLLARVAAEAAGSAGFVGLTGPLHSDEVGVVLTVEEGGRADDDEAMDAFAEAIHRDVHDRGLGRVTIAVGTTVRDIRAVRDSFVEAEQVAAATASLPGDRAFFSSHDVTLAGLIQLLRDDTRLQTFAERQLGRVLVEPEIAAPTLLDALGAFLEHGGNKLAAAASLGVSRPTLYQRLQRIEAILDVDFRHPETRMSLHVALLAHRAQTAG